MRDEPRALLGSENDARIAALSDLRRSGSRDGRLVVILSVLPLGIGCWAPIFAGARVRDARWIALGVLWTAATVAGWVLSIRSDGDSDAAGGLIILGWLGAIATAITIRPKLERLTGSPLVQAEAAAEERLAARRRALRIAHDNPALALEMGIGRPDRHEVFDGGLVDVNNAPASALMGLPGVDSALAKRIVEVREQVDGFSSVFDLGMTLDLDARLVDDLRERVVFLPR